MDSRDAIVTLKTLTPKRNPSESDSESMEALPEAKTPEGKLRSRATRRSWSACSRRGTSSAPR